MTPCERSPRSEGRLWLLSLSERVPAVKVELALLALECLATSRGDAGGSRAELSQLAVSRGCSGLSGLGPGSLLAKGGWK